MKKCSVCKSTLKRQKITYTQELEGSIYVVSGVPALVCPQCGEQYLEPDIVDRVQRVIEKGEKKELKPIHQVPVFHFA